ncbi:hypothetical protein BDQ12DRAFT_670113 [Crucibulum laeve]|uniref:Uncharacterized protein n=1 Tax=Crucibulum laeve TaxID=68775 RepID=A0A5C3LMS5_9AGAR|nr:hypothetical protein BDQ12DRAFT_670113 [Crucibulum laeve]
MANHSTPESSSWTLIFGAFQQLRALEARDYEDDLPEIREFDGVMLDTGASMHTNLMLKHFNTKIIIYWANQRISSKNKGILVLVADVFNSLCPFKSQKPPQAWISHSENRRFGSARHMLIEVTPEGLGSV